MTINQHGICALIGLALNMVLFPGISVAQRVFTLVFGVAINVLMFGVDLNNKGE